MAVSETFSKQFLSASDNGRAVLVAASASPGTTIHTAHATSKDEVYLEVCNEDTVSRTITVEFGGTTNPNDRCTITVPAKNGWNPLVTGQILSNSLVVKAFASAANVLMIRGHVNRIGTV
jgi:hypothetical protein